MSDIILVDTMQLDATVQQAHEFVRNPQRIADYYPDLYDCGTFIENEAIWCYGKAGVALLEYPADQMTEQRIVMQVTTNLKLKPPFSIESMQEIKANSFMSLDEDWDFVGNDGGVLITKTWRNLRKHKLKWLPIPLKRIIRRTALRERSILIEAWNKAAKNSQT